MTLPEVQLWQALRRAGVGGLGFWRQHAVGPYILDFYAPAMKLAVEIDGAAHDIESIARKDIVRDAWLVERGIHVLRLNVVDVLDSKRRESVLATIAAVAGFNEV